MEQILKRIDNYPIDNRYIPPNKDKEIVVNPNPDKAFIDKHYDIIHFNTDDVKQNTEYGATNEKNILRNKNIVPDVLKIAFKELDYKDYIKIKDKKHFQETKVSVCEDCYLSYINPNHIISSAHVHSLIDIKQPHAGYIKTSGLKLKYMNEVGYNII